MDRRFLLKLPASGTALTAALAQIKGETFAPKAGQPATADMPPLQGPGIETRGLVHPNGTCPT